MLVLPRTHPAAADDQPVDLRALRHDPWLAAPAGEPSRQAVDRLLAAHLPPLPAECAQVRDHRRELLLELGIGERAQSCRPGYRPLE